MSEIEVLILTGTIGAGKTTLAEMVSENLHERGIRHALIDLDWLGQVYPVPEGHDPYSYELALQNLSAVWPNFLALGISRAVIAGTLLDQQQLERLRTAAPRTVIKVALVSAQADLVSGRLRARDRGSLLKDFLARSGSVAADIERAAIHDVVIQNDERPPIEVAQDLLNLVGWSSSEDPPPPPTGGPSSSAEPEPSRGSPGDST